jgi:hypothetical protein
MRKTTVGWITAAGLLILSLVLGGCAAVQQAEQAQQAQQTKSAEELLSAAGFKQIFPATPKLKARLQAMPQKQIFMASRGSKLFYVYADAAGCGCLYAGNQQQYQAYQQLAAQYKLARMQYQAAEMNQAAAMDWGEWGEAGPWY